jgi:hypothetical protein
MKPGFTAATLVCAFALPSLAQADDQYLDNRSDAAQLVRSLYNAVNRKEYSRAWDYYGDQKPAKSYDKFVQGYADTSRVDVATGSISSEGAAGSTFYQVPIAIRATDNNGDQKVFAGCYTARLANPQIQEPPFKPMHIEKGALKPVNDDGGALSDALPQNCGDAPPAKADATQDSVVEMFKTAYGASCDTLQSDDPEAAKPEVNVLKYRYGYETDSDPEHEAKLFAFNCSQGAYNFGSVYYLADDMGIRQLQFAEPELDIQYNDPDDQKRVKSINIIGYTASDQLINSEYDPKEKALTSFDKWRGIGDSSDSGKWIFRGGTFTLVHYEVDPTEDEEENPQTVVDFEAAP